MSMRGPHEELPADPGNCTSEALGAVLATYRVRSTATELGLSRSAGDGRGGRALAEVVGGGDRLVAGAGEERLDDGVHVGLVEAETLAVVAGALALA